MKLHSYVDEMYFTKFSNLFMYFLFQVAFYLFSHIKSDSNLHPKMYFVLIFHCSYELFY